MNTIYFLCNSKLHIFKLIILFLLFFNFRWMKKRIHGMLKIFKNFHFWIVPSVISKLKQKYYSKIMQLKIIQNQGCKTFQPRIFQPQYSTRDFQPQYLSPDFSIMNSLTLDFSTSELLSSWCQLWTFQSQYSASNFSIPDFSTMTSSIMSFSNITFSSINFKIWTLQIRSLQPQTLQPQTLQTLTFQPVGCEVPLQ